MKVLEKVDSSSWRHNCDCSDCDAKLEIDVKDLHYNHSESDGIHPASGSFSVTCPVCSNNVYVPASDIPKIVKIEAQQKYQRRSTSYLDR